MDRETVVSSLFDSKEKRERERDRDQNVVQTSRDRRNLHKILEREDEFAVNGENWPSKDCTKLRQTWRLNIGKKESSL